MAQENPKFFDLIERQLAAEPFTVGGVLQKYVVINHAQNGDETLLKLLLESEFLKKKFFKKIAGALVFDHRAFVWYLEQKNYLNDSYTKYKNKIGLTVDGKYLKQRNEVALVWPYKDCYLEGGQSREEDKRDEIFFNEELAQDEITQLLWPKALTNASVHGKTGARAFQAFTRDAEANKKRGMPADTITDNLIVKGNNLLALHSLKKQFAGKVKLIYIDPPYNTGGDANIFTYNNNFNHSTWLTFMKNRLEVAKEMLRDDGFIAIAIDHAELFYLGVLADEVFGRENRLGIVSIAHKPGGVQFAKLFSTSNDFAIVYSKDKALASFNKVVLDEDVQKNFDKTDDKGTYKEEKFMRDFDPNATRERKPDYWYPVYVSKDLSTVSLVRKKGYFEILPISSTKREVTWNQKKETFLRNFNAGEVFVKERNGKLELFRKVRASQPVKTLWTDKRYDATSHGTKLLKSTMGRKPNFSYPKSLYTVLDTIQIMTGKNDIVLDFFAGSGTTGHAVLALNEEDGGNRQFILVEQLDDHIAVCKERITKVMKNANSGAQFVYFELKQHNQNFMNDIQSADNTRKLMSVWNAMKANSSLDYNLDMKAQVDHMADFKKLTLAQQKQHLCGILDKNQLYVNLPSLNDRDRACSAAEKKVTADFYRIGKVK